MFLRMGVEQGFVMPSESENEEVAFMCATCRNAVFRNAACRNVFRVLSLGCVLCGNVFRALSLGRCL